MLRVQCGHTSLEFMPADVSQLILAAGRSANAGRWGEAEGLWQQVLDLEPQHPQALCSLGIHAVRRGDFAEAFKLLTAATNYAPKDFVALMTLSSVCRQLEDPGGELDAIDRALAADAYFLPGVLAKASWLERYGSRAAAVARYANALKIAPPASAWPAVLQPQLEHAHTVVDAHSRALEKHLTEKLASFQDALSVDDAARWREATAIRAGRSKPFDSQSNQLHVPRLPAIPFFDAARFPGLDNLAAKTDRIRDELMALLQSDMSAFQPYITYKPGDPVNQWQELNHSPRWSVFHLWRAGVPVRENLERCPETAQALAAVGMANIDELCPNALFSALAPRTHIPPHNGETNARLVAHLPLSVPHGCRFRVGFEERVWKVGEVLVFDDTIEHEARNDSDELRVVLIFDLWNPLLTATERDMVNTMAKASRQFGGQAESS